MAQIVIANAVIDPWTMADENLALRVDADQPRWRLTDHVY